VLGSILVKDLATRRRIANITLVPNNLKPRSLAGLPLLDYGSFPGIPVESIWAVVQPSNWSQLGVRLPVVAAQPR